MQEMQTVQSVEYLHAVSDSVKMALRIEQFAIMVEQDLRNEMVNLSTLFNFSLLIQTLDRPDLKSKIAKSLSAHLAKLKLLGCSDHIDPAVLNDYVRKIEVNLNNLRLTTSRHAEILKKIPSDL